MNTPDDTLHAYRDRAEQLPPEVRAAMTAGRDGGSTPPHPAAGIGELTMNDGPLGLVSRGMDERESSTLLPSATALAASWDTDLVFQLGQLIAEAARDSDTTVVLGPNLGLPLSPLSGRSFEMYSEDPWLSGTLATAFVSGVQSQGVASCVKHLVGNDTETKRQFMNAVIDEATLREVHLLPFEMAMAEGAWMAMMAYNKVNGVPAVENADIIGIVKDEWGFDGVVVSDWFATKRTVETANAGVDLEMPGPALFLGPAVADAVAAGTVPDERLTDMAARLLLLADRVGRGAQRSLPPVVRHDTVEALRAAAAAGFVLLTNRNNVLPLSPVAGTRIAVIGPNAATPCYQGGTFGRVNIDPSLPTPLEALRHKLSDAQIGYEVGAVVEGIKPLGGLNPVSPDGQQGVQVEYFTAADPTTPAATEVRPGSSFVWWQDIPGIGSPAEGGRIRITATVTAEIAGTHTFCVGGTGDATLTVDGTEIVRWTGPEMSDVMGVVARGDTAGAPAALHPGQRVTIVADMTLSPGRVQAFTAGYYPPVPADILGSAVKVAADSDVVILIVGDNTSTSRESADRDTTALSPAQGELIRRVTAANPNTIVVVNASRSVDMPWADDAAAVLMTWFPGEQFGAALADVLMGRRAPGGRLPVSIAQRDEDYAGYGVALDAELNLTYSRIVPGGYGHLEKSGTPARFAFGHGLSYTSFEHGPVTVSSDSKTSCARIGIEVRNVGYRPGRQVVQVYGSAPGETYSRLIGYGTATLEPGERTVLDIGLAARAFARWNVDTHRWVVPAGDHTVRVGTSAQHTLSSHVVSL